jgi:hypothetical protein
MKKIFIILLFILISSLTLAQDIVYDSIRGDRNYWLRIKGGQTEQTSLGLMYENQGVLTQSKVISSAGILDGLIPNRDYKDYSFNYDTLTYEIKTKDSLNAYVYRFFYNDTTYQYFLAVRKAPFGASVFEGQYYFITPLVSLNSIVRVYDGIGTNRRLVVTLVANQMDEFDIQEYELSNQVTVKGVKVSKVLRSSRTQTFIGDEDDNIDFADYVKIWPNPVADILHIKMMQHDGVIINLFSTKPMLVYQKEVTSDYHEIDVTRYSSGSYILMITDMNGIILYTGKLIII